MSIPDAQYLGKQRRRCWLRASTQSKYVTTRSAVGYFIGHWSAAARRSLRCEGSGCPICASGGEPKAFMYCFVELAEGEVMVWEISPRLLDLAMEIDELAKRGIACLVQIWREGTAQNSPVSARVLDQKELDELDIVPFIDSLGYQRDHFATPHSPSREKTQSSMNRMT